MKLHITTESGKTATVEFHQWDTQLDQARDSTRTILGEAFENVFIESVNIRFEDEVEQDTGEPG